MNMSQILVIIVFIGGLIVLSGTLGGTVLWFFWDTVVKFVPISLNPTWFECVKFGWVVSALFKSTSNKVTAK